TPELADGTIDIKKAINVASSFEISKEFWAYLVQEGHIKAPENFIRSTPHISFVWGDKDVEFLRKRWEKLKDHPLFHGMEYSEDIATLTEWMPLVMKDRDP